MLSLSTGLGLDLGTANTLIYEKGKGIILNEPSVVALEVNTREVLAVGTEAKGYLGRTPSTIEIIRPLKNGVIYDFAVTQQMIRKFLTMAGINRRLFKPRIVVGVPNGSTQVEKRAIIEAAEQAGGKSVHLVNEPMAVAVGLELPITTPGGLMVLDVGGGTSEGVIISAGAVMAEEARRVAGDAATEAIMRYIRRKYSLAIGENAAEEIKHTIGSALPLRATEIYKCRGKSLQNGKPTAIEITDADIREALEEINSEFINMVKRLLDQSSPEVASDLVNNGIHLTGGGGLLKGLAQRLTQATDIPVHIPEFPLTTTAFGLGRIMENMNLYQDLFVN